MSSLVVLSPQPLKKRIHPGFFTALAGSASSSFGVAAFLSASASVSLGVREEREREKDELRVDRPTEFSCQKRSTLSTHTDFCSCFACFRSCCFRRKYASLKFNIDEEYSI